MIRSSPRISSAHIVTHINWSCDIDLFALYILNDKRNLTLFGFALFRKVQILEIYENANFTCRTSKSVSKENLSIWYEI